MKVLGKKWTCLNVMILSLIFLLIGCSTQPAANPPSNETATPVAAPEQKEETPKPEAPAPAKELVKWTHGIVKAKGDSGFILMAKEKEFFKNHGLDVEILEFEGDATMLQALVAGQLDSMEANPAGTISAVQKGANLKIIGSTMPGMPYAVYVKEGINSLEDLKGKTVGISKPGALPEIILKAMLLEKGIDPNSVNLVNAGSDAQRYQALVAGKIDAVANASEFAAQAKQDKVKVLAYAADIVPKYPRFVIVSSDKTLKEKPEAAVGFLAAEMEGLTYALNHKEETIKLAAKTIKVPEDDQRVISIFDEVKEKNYLSPQSEIPVDRIEWLQETLIKLGRQKDKVDINTLIDPSFREQALKVANLNQ